jgi:regulator of replication initiation timing
VRKQSIPAELDARVIEMLAQMRYRALESQHVGLEERIKEEIRADISDMASTVIRRFERLEEERVVVYTSGGETPEDLPAPSRRLAEENERLREENAQLRSLLGRHDDQHPETTGERIDVEEEIDRILREKSYGKLNFMLDLDRKSVLDALCMKTKEGRISLKTQQGKQIWQNVTEFYSDRYGEKEVNSVYSRLAECSRTRFQKGSNEFIYDALFAIHGGANADFRAGFWLAGKYAKRSLDRRIKKVKKTLQG